MSLLVRRDSKWSRSWCSCPHRGRGKTNSRRRRNTQRAFQNGEDISTVSASIEPNVFLCSLPGPPSQPRRTNIKGMYYEEGPREVDNVAKLLLGSLINPGILCVSLFQSFQGSQGRAYLFNSV